MGLNGQNLWLILQQNWIHFSWLTGETPETFNILVQRIERNFLNMYNIGRSPAIDFRNQVLLKCCNIIH